MKTLHPKIFGGILGRPALESDAADMAEHAIGAENLPGSGAAKVPNQLQIAESYAELTAKARNARNCRSSSIFGGILGRPALESDAADMAEHAIGAIDLVVVDLYPFEDTVASGASKADIIEKIDIGGISLIRAPSHMPNLRRRHGTQGTVVPLRWWRHRWPTGYPQERHTRHARE